MSTQGSERETKTLTRSQFENVIKNLKSAIDEITDLKTRKTLKAIFALQQGFRKSRQQSYKAISKDVDKLRAAIKELQEAIAAIEGADALTNLNPRKRPRRQLKL